VTTEYITLTGSVTGNDRDGFKVAHHWDGQRFTSKPEAVTNGFRLAESDDFNVGIVRGRTLASIWWMDKRIGEPAETLAEIAKEIGL
jgi:hypothetical protein